MSYTELKEYMARNLPKAITDHSLKRHELIKSVSRMTRHMTRLVDSTEMLMLFSGGMIEPKKMWDIAIRAQHSAATLLRLVHRPETSALAKLQEVRVLAEFLVIHTAYDARSKEIDIRDVNGGVAAAVKTNLSGAIDCVNEALKYYGMTLDGLAGIAYEVNKEQSLFEPYLAL